LIYTPKKLVDEANKGNVEAQLLTSAMVMLYETPNSRYSMMGPAEILREIIHHRQQMVATNGHAPHSHK
jgi:hypothetical protein